MVIVFGSSGPNYSSARKEKGKYARSLRTSKDAQYARRSSILSGACTDSQSGARFRLERLQLLINLLDQLLNRKRGEGNLEGEVAPPRL